ncbi:hypothetical protein [Flagellimonas allohymeniacidonis]|nr:hypothetical protein [Allomuricauda hymeniacidonis]
MKSNYLCDLLDTNTPNGLPNPARSYARLSLLVLCSSLILLWYDLPKLFKLKSINLSIMRTTSILSLGLTLFLAAGNHDVILRIAGLLGVMALISLFIELFKARYYALFVFGIWCLLIFVLNYLIYETGFSIVALPIIQKITFLSFLLWFAFLNITLFRVIKRRSNDWK